MVLRVALDIRMTAYSQFNVTHIFCVNIFLLVLPCIFVILLYVMPQIYDVGFCWSVGLVVCYISG